MGNPPDKNRRKDNRLALLYKGVQGNVKIPTDELIPKQDVAKINTQWPIRFFMQVKTHIRKASFPKLSGTGITSPILISTAELSDGVSKFTSLVRTRD